VASQVRFWFHVTSPGPVIPDGKIYVPIDRGR
jgi:hypothetical protein